MNLYLEYFNLFEVKNKINLLIDYNQFYIDLLIDYILETSLSFEIKQTKKGSYHNSNFLSNFS